MLEKNILLIICILGQGGFGHVVLCKNKLDGRQYAMKKIRLKDKILPLNDRIVRFVSDVGSAEISTLCAEN